MPLLTNAVKYGDIESSKKWDILKIPQMSLDDRQIKHAKPKTKPYKLTNGIG